MSLNGQRACLHVGYEGHVASLCHQHLAGSIAVFIVGLLPRALPELQQAVRTQTLSAHACPRVSVACETLPLAYCQQLCVSCQGVLYDPRRLGVKALLQHP